MLKKAGQTARHARWGAPELRCSAPLTMKVKCQMKQENLERYCQLMLEIRHRASAVAALEEPNRDVMPDFIRVELLVMQIRKILEIVALGSMVANEKEYLEAYDKIEKHYHAKKILRFVEKINPDFYPKPVSHTKTGDSTHNLERKSDQDGSHLTLSLIHI